MENNVEVVGYNGKCVLCGSSDGMIQKGQDGKYRNICRVMGCKAFYRPAPYDGYDFQNDVSNPFETKLIDEEIKTVHGYLFGIEEEKELLGKNERMGD